MTHVEIPRFGYKPGDFKATPFSFELSRIGVQSAGPRSFAHRHSYYHVLWLTRGDGVHVIDFEEFTLKPPSVFFIAPPPGSLLELRGTGGPVHLQVLR